MDKPVHIDSDMWKRMQTQGQQEALKIAIAGLDDRLGTALQADFERMRQKQEVSDEG